MDRWYRIMGWCCVAALVCCSNKSDSEVPTVHAFVAAGLYPAFVEIADAFTARTGVRFQINAGSSSMLARQMEQGAPVDLFLSAHPKWVDQLLRTEKASTVKTWALGRLVWATATNEGISAEGFHPLDDRLSFRKVAVGDFERVPLGQYTREAFDKLGLLEALQPKLLFCEDAAQVVQRLETGEAELGVVYLSNAKLNPRLRILAELPEESHERIRYQLWARASTRAKFAELFTFIENDVQVQALMNKYGLIVPNESLTESRP